MHSNSIELRKIIASNIRQYRKRHNLSQEKFAQICELHRTYIGSIERAEKNITLKTLCTLASVLEISVPELLTQHYKE
jgi:transcriptional regulator with XRE-family HTH domain